MSARSKTANLNNGTRRSDAKRQMARQRYIEMGEQVLLEQIREDSRDLDKSLRAIGPFSRLDANVVAERNNKTRGSINNMFGSQAAFQKETMALALSAGLWIEEVSYPAPGDFAKAEDWIRAFFKGQSFRGPAHNSPANVNYGSMWALWLGTVPYGLWSEAISKPSMAEHVQWVRSLESVFETALDHFDTKLVGRVSINELASAAANLIEGAWLNQCLSRNHPFDHRKPIQNSLVTSGLILWRGATRQRS
jgi:hypothetical protein